MKKILLALFISCCCWMLAQNVKNIAQKVTAINQTTNYKIKTVPNSYFVSQDKVTDNGIELKGCYKDNKIRKIEEFTGLSAWNIITQYFFSEEEDLIFVYVKKFQNLEGNTFLKNPKLIAEERNYYEKGKLVKKLEKGQGRIESIDYVKEAEHLKKDLQNYK
jgi:hypothetical protein